MTDVFKRKVKEPVVVENPWIAEIFENQRWGPLEGWSDFELNGDYGDPLAWQWPNGQANVPPNPPPPLAPGWDYDESPWEIDMNMAGVDEDGWIYAENFADLDKHVTFPKESLPRKEAICRRRFHIRPVVSANIAKAAKPESVLNVREGQERVKIVCAHCGNINLVHSHQLATQLQHLSTIHL